MVSANKKTVLAFSFRQMCITSEVISVNNIIIHKVVFLFIKANVHQQIIVYTLLQMILG